MNKFFTGWLLFLLGMVSGFAQIDPEKRQLIQIGYNQPIEGKAPIAGYAFYLRNEPNFIHTNITLRLAISPLYLDSDLGFTGQEETDWSIGLAGGGFADSYFEYQRGLFHQEQSFIGHGGEISGGVYHRFNPSQLMPLNGVARISAHYRDYVRDDNTSPTFSLPKDNASINFRTGLRLGGREPTIFPQLGAELSVWYEGQYRTASGLYGFGDRKVESSSHLFWGRALFIYTFPKINHNVSANLTMGTSIDPDRFSAYRLGGLLPMASEFPLILPGYYYQEISARRFLLFSGQYAFPLDRKNQWTITTVGSIAKVAYLSPSLEQPDRLHSGVGMGLGYRSPKGAVHAVLGYSYGFDAVRDHGRGAQSIGLLFQWDLEAKHHPPRPVFDIESPQKSRGLFEIFNP